MNRRKKILWWVVLLYLLFDLRPLLLIPNLILYCSPCGRYSSGNGVMELKVFPRLCIAGDPIVAVIRSHDLPLGNDFERSYDRSGLFLGLQFSTATNSPQHVDTLYWTCGMGGGLGGEVHPEKTIWLQDYVRMSEVGLYRIKFRYRDGTSSPKSKQLDYNLGDFPVISFPENPVSKVLKQAVLTVMLLVPSDNVRILAVKWLGYQETTFATYAVATYFWRYADAEDSTQRIYNNSLAETHRGVLRNYHYRSACKALRGFKDKHNRNLLQDYLFKHLVRLVYVGEDPMERLPTEVIHPQLKELAACVRAYLDEDGQKNIRGYLTMYRSQYTDEYLLNELTKCDEKLKSASEDKTRARLVSWKERTLKQLKEPEQKEQRHRIVALIDVALDYLGQAAKAANK